MATKDFVEYSPNTGNRDTIINVTASLNSGDSRSTSLNITGKGISKTVIINQENSASFKMVTIRYNPTSTEGYIIVDGTIFSKDDNIRNIEVKNELDLIAERPQDVASSVMCQISGATITSFNRLDNYSNIIVKAQNINFVIVHEAIVGVIPKGNPVSFRLNFKDQNKKSILIKYWNENS